MANGPLLILKTLTLGRESWQEWTEPSDKANFLCSIHRRSSEQKTGTSSCKHALLCIPDQVCKLSKLPEA